MARIIHRLVAVVLVGLICGVCDVAAAWAQSTSAESVQAAQQQPPDSSPSSSSPASATAEPGNAAPSSPEQPDKPKEEPLPNAPSISQQPATDQNQVQIPSGTAAATIASPEGNLASKPAGAAIAPSSQHRSRAFFVKLGLIVGAGVALGSVLALSQSSPGAPPGAR